MIGWAMRVRDGRGWWVEAGRKRDVITVGCGDSSGMNRKAVLDLPGAIELRKALTRAIRELKAKEKRP